LHLQPAETQLHETAEVPCIPLHRLATQLQMQSSRVRYFNIDVRVTTAVWPPMRHENRLEVTTQTSSDQV